MCSGSGQLYVQHHHERNVGVECAVVGDDITISCPIVSSGWTSSAITNQLEGWDDPPLTVGLDVIAPLPKENNLD